MSIFGRGPKPDVVLREDYERLRAEDLRIAADLRAFVHALLAVEAAARLTHREGEDGCSDQPLHDALDALDVVRERARLLEEAMG